MLRTSALKAAVWATIAVGSIATLGAQQTTHHQRHTINARDARQQARINRGVADGQITPRGAAAANARQGGHLTAADRHRIARQQDRTSQNIYERNHNAATDPGVAPR